MNEMVVGLPDVAVLGMSASEDELEIHVVLDAQRAACASCGVPAHFKGWREVVLRDRPFGDRTFGDRTAVLHWHKRRWGCAERDCPKKTWTEEDRRIAAPRMAITDRAGR
jgi:hypothetical protein